MVALHTNIHDAVCEDLLGLGVSIRIGTAGEKLLQLPTWPVTSAASGLLLLGHQPAAAAAATRKEQENLYPIQHLQQHWHWYLVHHTALDLGSKVPCC
jgi:hypothetical protein